MKVTIDRAGRSELMLIEEATQEDILPGSFRNFRGEKRKNPHTGEFLNEEGKRNFNLALNFPSEVLDDLASMGLNIKTIMPKEPEYGDEPLRFAKVNVATDGKFPPELYLMNGKRKKALRENEIALLDASRFSNAELVIRLYHKNENSTTLYLSKGFFWIEQDPISAKYADYEVYADDEDGEEMPFH